MMTKEVVNVYEETRKDIIDLGRIMAPSDQQFDVFRKKVLDLFGEARRKALNNGNGNSNGNSNDGEDNTGR